MIELIGGIIGGWLFDANDRLRQRAAIRHLRWKEKARADFLRLRPVHRVGQAVARENL